MYICSTQSGDLIKADSKVSSVKSWTTRLIFSVHEA